MAQVTQEQIFSLATCLPGRFTRDGLLRRVPVGGRPDAGLLFSYSGTLGGRDSRELGAEIVESTEELRRYTREEASRW